MEWTKDQYNKQYENWMPWMEDQYLKWFTSDNKASYATKDTLDKSKVTGVAPVDKLQDGVNSTLSGQVGQGGLFQPVGDAASKEGVNRAERGGKDDSGSYIGAAGGKASEYGQGAAGALGNAGSSVGSSVTGILGGGGNKNEEGQGEQAQKK